MLQLTATIYVPNDWGEADDVKNVLTAGLRAELVVRWRKKHGPESWPSEDALKEVEVTALNYFKPQEGPVQVQEQKQPKLDRKTRGQVRRATNRLSTIERRVFESSSNPDRTYEAVVYQTGKVLCNCQGWTMKRAGKPRQCKHTRELIGDREVIDDGEFQYIASIAETATHCPT